MYILFYNGLLDYYVYVKAADRLVCKHQRLKALHKWTKVKFGLIYIRLN